MKVEDVVSISVYKDMLELQKQLFEMLIEGNLKTDLVQNIKENSQKPQNIIEGRRVSIHV